VLRAARKTAAAALRNQGSCSKDQQTELNKVSQMATRCCSAAKREPNVMMVQHSKTAHLGPSRLVGEGCKARLCRSSKIVETAPLDHSLGGASARHCNVCALAIAD
jgi:hypothetical protein